MVQNLKIDIIYYDTPSDFEFEFNLGGCCHSRILNSHTHQPKEMLSSLARAVGRSRVILIVGSLHGDGGLIELVSKAVSIPLVSANVAEYAITAPDSPMILGGSLPLVSKDGTLSGCIIESGPQSIILLDSTKALRKDICENLVFPYITALSRIPETDNVAYDDSDNATEEAETVSEAVEEEIADTTEAENQEETEEIAEETESNIFTEEITEEEAEIVFPEEDPDIILSGAKMEFSETQEPDSVSLNDNYIIDSNNNAAAFEDDDEYYDEPKKNKTRKPLSKLTITILILCGLILVVAGLLLYMLVYEPLSNSINVSEYISEFFKLL